MSTPTTIKAEYTRAMAAEKVLQDQIAALIKRIAVLEKPPVPPPVPVFSPTTFDPTAFRT